mgnify:CR=1 FL=1
MKPDLKLVEARGDDVTFTFGRFNPPTIGHEKLIDATKKIGGRNYRVYASHTQDSRRNPLDHKTKISYMKRMFRKHSSHIIDDAALTAIHVAVKLYDEGFKNLTMVVGSDRVRDFQKLLDDYNGVKARHGLYDFKTIKVKSAGERDPDAEGISGMSASKMRKAAQSNDYDSFAQAIKIAGGKKIFKKEYEGALKLYNQFKTRGDKPAVAMHKAATSYRHVDTRQLQKYIDAIGSAR